LLRIDNKDEKAAAVIKASADSDEGVLDIFKDGKPRTLISADARGGMLSVLNKDGKRVVGIGTVSDGSGIVQTSNSKGQVTSQSP
jgi:hypothetical protein